MISVHPSARAPVVATMAKAAFYEVTIEGDVARCAVMNPSDALPAEGAAAAEQMQRLLLDRVLRPGAEYIGLIFDVRKGPPVFGPRTRAALEVLFAAADPTQTPLAALVGGSSIQRLQFASLCREKAPKFGAVVLADLDAIAWVRGHPLVRCAPPAPEPAQ